jgi:mono/diheme cytochrome c family protein
MNVPDLRSSVVQNKADGELAQIISNGKGGMPAFKSSFSDDQIQALVTYVRWLHQKK